MCRVMANFLRRMDGRLREQARSHRGMHFPVGASLLAIEANAV
jgi:hypothetical protein